MITTLTLDHNAPLTPDTCPAAEVRAVSAAPNGVLEDQIPTTVYVTTLDPHSRTPNQLRTHVLTILAFEYVSLPRSPGFWQVTYRACI